MTPMKIQINEVWKSEGRSQEIAVIEAPYHPSEAVWDWIHKNRADLQRATGLNDHGFYAVAVGE